MSSTVAPPAVVPTSLLIILLPSMILLFSPTPAAGSPIVVTKMNTEGGQDNLDLNKHRSDPVVFLPPHESFVPYSPPNTRKPGESGRPGPWPQNGNSHGMARWKKTTTTTATPSPIIPPVSTERIGYSKIGQGICYELCKDQMGGVACQCDMLPVG